MTVPREVRLSKQGEEIVLVQRPAPELETLRHCRLFQARRIVETRGGAVSVLADPSRRYGCGHCQAVCPEGAITVQERHSAGNLHR